MMNRRSPTPETSGAVAAYPSAVALDIISDDTLRRAKEIRRNRDEGCTDYLKRSGKDRGSSIERPLGEIGELELVDWLRRRGVAVEYHPYLAGTLGVAALHEIVCGWGVNIDVKASWRSDFLRAGPHWELEVTPKAHKKLNLTTEFYYVFCYVSGPPYRVMIVGAMLAQVFHDPNKPPPWYKAGDTKNGRMVASDHWSLQLSDPRLIRPLEFLSILGPVKPAPKIVARASEAFVHVCEVCGAWGSFGYGMKLREGVLGTWYCAEHRPV